MQSVVGLLITAVYWKVTTESSSGEILRIGYDLTELWP